MMSRFSGLLIALNGNRQWKLVIILFYLLSSNMTHRSCDSVSNWDARTIWKMIGRQKDSFTYNIKVCYDRNINIFFFKKDSK